MPRRSGWLIALSLLAAVLFAGLGVWQLQRLQWKRALIERTQRHVNAAPVAAPMPEDRAGLQAANADYLHVQVTGTFQNGQDTLVQAVTARGPGFWVMAPLRTDTGPTVLINRGFVPGDHAARSERVTGEISGRAVVTGLLRQTEPRGGFLRANRPDEDRWYSRDVAAIASRRGLTNVVPYFIDADSAPNSGGLPIGGMTVIVFRNQHLQYALTWFGLSLVTMAYAAVAIRDRLVGIDG